MDTFPSLLLNLAKSDPRQVFVRSKKYGVWSVTTRGEALDRVAVLAQALERRNLKAGERFGVFGPNSDQMYLAYLAVQSLGAIPVPISHSAYGESLKEIIDGAGVTMVLALEQQHVDALLECGQQSVREIIYISDRGLANYNQPELVWLDTIVEGINPDRAKLEVWINQRDASDAAVLATNSGVVHAAQLIELSHSALINTARAIGERCKVKTSDELMAYLPLGFSSDFLFSYSLALVSGCRMNCPEGDDTILGNLQEIGPTILFGPAYVYKYIYSHAANRVESLTDFGARTYQWSMRRAMAVAEAWARGEKPSGFVLLLRYLALLITFRPYLNVYGLNRLRLALSGGTGMPAAVMKFYHAIGVDLRETYGMVESSGCLTIQGPKDWVDDCMGQPLDGVQLELRDGEVWFRGPGQLTGIYGDPETSAERTVDGWTRTYDVGMVDDEGRLHLRGRTQRMTQFDGADFSADYMESLLKSSKYIRQVAVFGQDREYPVAIIAVDGNITRTWADRNNLRYTGYAELSAHEEVKKMVCNQLQEINQSVAENPNVPARPVKRFALLNRAFMASQGEVTETRKVRWNTFAELHTGLLDALYSGATEYTYTDSSDGRSYTLQLGDV